MEQENNFRDNENQTVENIQEDKFSQRNERTDQDHEVEKDFQEGKKEAEKEMEEGEKVPQSQAQGIEKEVEGGSKKDEEDLQAHAQEAEENGEEAQENEKEDSQDHQADQEEILSSNPSELARQYSCSYDPPAYMPNFTIVDTNGGEESSAWTVADKDSGHSTRNIWLSMVLSAVVAVVVGGLCGFFVANLWGNNRGGLYRPDATITKNNGSIEVNEIVGSTGYKNLTVEEVAAYAAESVVEITTSQVQYDVMVGNYVKSGAGSGVIISENGYIITNHHVVDGATAIKVRLSSGTEYTADLIGSNARSDVAVIRINATKLKAATLGKSSELKVGQGVVAIGNPLGTLGGTVTDGIISAIDRQVNVEGYPMTLLQTNAAINHGNSGGGLFNMAGELIGIVNAKMSDSETGIEGLGFAIPIDVAWNKASDLMRYGYVTGELILDFSAEAKSGGFIGAVSVPAGVYITASNHDQLKKNDRIVSMNDVTINSINDYCNVLYQLKKCDTLKLVVSRLDSSGFRAEFHEYTVTMTVRVTEAKS